MDKKKDKREVVIVKIFYLLLISYIVLFISKSSGYYDYQAHKQVELNESTMKKFEDDIKNGKNVTLTDFLKERDIKYNNNVSDIGYSISKEIGYIISNGLDSTMSFLGELFNG